ncbi:hypothetical protein BH23BAC1_BH23BAC1_09100 [soil metagenome]
MRYFIVLVGLFISHTCFAQFVKGIKAGLSSSRIEVDEIINGSAFRTGDAILGYHAGLFGRYYLGALYIQPEAVFTTSGGEIEVTPPSNQMAPPSPYTLEISYNKIDIPLLLGIRFARFFRVQAGPTGSILLAAEQKNNATGATMDILDNYKQLTIAYQAGFGVDFGKLVVDLKYEDNLSDFGDQVGGFNTDQRNSQILLSLGYIF